MYFYRCETLYLMRFFSGVLLYEATSRQLRSGSSNKKIMWIFFLSEKLLFYQIISICLRFHQRWWQNKLSNDVFSHQSHFVESYLLVVRKGDWVAGLSTFWIRLVNSWCFAKSDWNFFFSTRGFLLIAINQHNSHKQVQLLWQQTFRESFILYIDTSHHLLSIDGV